jgi:hypothetical protein
VDGNEALQLMDCVVNRTLIPKNLNIIIGKRPPCEYLAELKKVNSKLEASLQDHLVPPELTCDATWNGRFREFLDTRAKEIMSLIERYAIEPTKEMEARHLAVPEVAVGSKPSARLAPGLRTPVEAFTLPILRALQTLGGRAQMQQVLERVGAEMKDQLREVDFTPLPSDPKRPRWKNNAQWARNTMVIDGLLKKDSPHGIWEMTDTGSRYLKRHSPSA